MASHGIAWHRMTSHGIAWHRMALHDIAWHRTASHRTAPYRFESCPIVEQWQQGKIRRVHLSLP